jgi:hypothetical protein
MNTNNWRGIRSVFLLLLVIVSPGPWYPLDNIAPPIVIAQNVPESGQSSSKESLEVSVKLFLATLKDRDEEALTQQFSKGGVVFGIDSDPISMQAIRKRMKKNEQLYCLFFDTRCLRRDPSFQKQFSLRDSLVNGKGHHWQVAINLQSQPITGEVRLFVEDNPNRSGTNNEFCNLTYILEGAAWKIREVLFY